MASSILDKALLALLAFLLPLHLCSRALRLLGKPSRRPNCGGSAAQSLLRLAAVPVLLAAVCVLSDSSSGNTAVITELQELKAKTAQLDFILKENTRTLNLKILELEEKQRSIQDMEKKIQVLQDELYQTKESVSDPLFTEERVHHLENQVQVLLDQSQKSSYNFKILESSVDAVEGEAEIAALKVEKMESVVREQWYQIRQLEQAFQLTKIMASKVQQRNSRKGQNKENILSSYLMKKVSQVIKSILGDYLLQGFQQPDSFFLGASSKLFTFQAYRLLNRIIQLAEECHRELQNLVKHAMAMNKFTAPLAVESVVFAMASTIMVAPITMFGSIFSLMKTRRNQAQR